MICLVSAQAADLSNAVTYYEPLNTTQTNRPISQARWFAKGELGAYPCPYVLGGAAITPWQADVKTRWNDGTVQFAIVSFKRTLSALGNASVEFRNCTDASSTPGSTGLTPAQLLTFNSSHWGAKIETITSGVTKFADARVMLNGLSSAPDQLRCWLCGPVVTQMIVEDRTTALSYDWGYQGTPITLNTGVVVDTTANTFTKTAHGLTDGKLVYVTSSFGSVPAPLVEGTTYTVLNSTANNFQLTSGSGAIDLTTTGTNVGVYQLYSDTTWADGDASHESLHPIFVITAYAGLAGVRIEYILENVWAERIQDQYFGNLNLYSGTSNATTATAMTDFHHAARSRWRKICWDGTAPAGEPVCGSDTGVISPRPLGLLVDYNLPYMIYSGASYPFDLRITESGVRIPSLWSCWNTTVCDSRDDLTKADIEAGSPQGTVHASGMLHSTQYQAGVDTAGFVGPQANMVSLHLYSMGNTTLSMTTRMQAAEIAMDPNYAQSYYENHYREDDTSKKYLSVYEEPGQTTLAFGMPLSSDARRTLTTQFAQTNTSDPADRIASVGPVRLRCDGSDCSDMNTLSLTDHSFKGGDASIFGTNQAHSWQPIFNSYLLLGDWYAMEELQFWVAWHQTDQAVSFMNGQFDFKGVNGQYGSHRPWQIFSNPENYRARAFGLRTLGYTIIVTPTEDASYAKMLQYYKSKYKLNIEIHEGVLGVQDGVFHAAFPSFTNWACTGWNNTTMALGAISPDDPQTSWCWGRMNQARGLNNPLHVPQWFYTHNKAYEDYTKTNEHDAQWHWWYMFHAMYQHKIMGIDDAITYLPYFQKMWVDSASDPGSRWLMSSDTIPVTDDSSIPFTNWANMADAFQPGYSTMNQWCAFWSGESTPPLCNPSSTSDVGSGPIVEYGATIALSEEVTGDTGFTGSRAYDFTSGNVPYQNWQGTIVTPPDATKINPRYAWVPYFIRNTRITPGDTQVSFLFSSSHGATCKVGMSVGAFTTSSSAADGAATVSDRFQTYVAIGLTPSTLYNYRITCGPGGGTIRQLGTVTTTATGSSTYLLVKLHPPTILGTATAIVDYGTTSGLGTSTAPVACTVSCTIHAPATTKQAIFYRYRYLDGGSATIRTSPVLKVILDGTTTYRN